MTVASALVAGMLVSAGTPALAAVSGEASLAATTARQAETQQAERNVNPQRAIARAEAAVAKNPRDAGLRAELGHAYIRAGRFESAATVLADAQALGDTSGRTALTLALAQIATGKGHDASEVLDAARDQIPAPDFGLAVALTGDTARGVAVLTDDLRSGDHSPTLRQNLGYAYALDGRWGDARMVATMDLPADKIDARLTQWAATAQPEAYRQRVAALLSVPLREDAGLPAALALSSAPATPAVPAPAQLASVDPAQAAGVAPAPASAEATASPAPASAALASPASASAPPVSASVATDIAASGPAASAVSAAPSVAPASAPALANAAPAAPTPASAVAAPALADSSPATVPAADSAPQVAPQVAAPPKVSTPDVAAQAPAPSSDLASAGPAPAAVPVPDAAPVASKRAHGQHGLRMALRALAPSGSHVVQLGAFSSEANAERARGVFTARNRSLASHQFVITQAMVKGRNFWRVAVSGFDTASAAGACGSIRHRGGACFAYAADHAPTGEALAMAAPRDMPVGHSHRR